MKISAIHLAQNSELTKTERPPRGGLSEIRSGVLLRRLRQPSASCANAFLAATAKPE